VHPPVLGDAFGTKRRLTAKHLIEHQTKSVNVTALSDRATRKLLRSHIGRRARCNLELLERTGQAGQTEIGDAHMAAGVEHDIGRLEIAVKDPSHMGCRHSGTYLPRDIHGLVVWKSPDSLEQRRQVLSVDVLHRNEMKSFGFADVVDSADVRMSHLTGNADFVTKPVEPELLSGNRRRQECERDGQAELQIVGAVDHAHATGAELGDNAVTISHHRAGDVAVTNVGVAGVGRAEDVGRCCRRLAVAHRNAEGQVGLPDRLRNMMGQQALDLDA